MKILTVIGARPQFVKAAMASLAIKEKIASGRHDGLDEVIVHTGQHYDRNMSGAFFDELGIPDPKYNLEIANMSHGAMTGKMLMGIEEIIVIEKPDVMLVYGDTNSTLAGALAAAKLHVPVAHVEAGLRSFNMRMPEEVNRILTDRISGFLFCPTETAVKNLANEGVYEGVYNVGDVMYDASILYRDIARRQSDALERLGLREKEYALTTCHRAENTDDPARLAAILDSLAIIARDLPVILPLHPRTAKIIKERGFSKRAGDVRIVEPIPFLDMVRLECSAKLILTDSGGVQKEAFFYRVPCITLRDETEWVETVESGWNVVTGADPDKILEAYTTSSSTREGAQKNYYGDGRAAHMILDIMLAERRG